MGQSTGRFGKLHSIGPAKVEIIQDMLEGGKSARECVALIHGEWKLLLDTKPDTLKKMLERFRGTEVRQAVIERVAGAAGKASVTVIAKKLNALEEMTNLVATQKRRFEKVLRQEDLQDKFLLKSASDEAKLFKEMLVELGKLQLETGALKRAPKTLTGQITDADGNLKQFEWTEAQAHIAEEIDGFVIDHDPGEAIGEAFLEDDDEEAAVR